MIPQTQAAILSRQVSHMETFPTLMIQNERVRGDGSERGDGAAVRPTRGPADWYFSNAIREVFHG